MGLRGPQQRDLCVAGHDLSNPDNIKIVKRRRASGIIRERQCIICQQRRAREWWANNRGKKEAS